ncbi:IS630 family transposase [Paenibacillus sinopodophylli]|uniref:IS630 family transposase n=1 Tax=Paenibacillus sinopodophylli TaxID=1837342 RepID=UPI001FE85B51|nr:IS630 family transposase [Paenibacillus sinopodophylli]
MDFAEYPGGPKKLTEQQEEQLKNVIADERPVDVGFEAKFTWTLKLIRAYILREFGQSYTLKGVSKILMRLGFSYTKATYSLARTNEKEQLQFRETTLPTLKEQLSQGKINHLLFEDKSSIRAYMALQYNWFPKGQQRKIPTYGQHKGAKLFAAIDYATGHVTHREEEELDANKLITDLTILDVRTRIARMLLRLTQQHGVPSDEGVLIDLKLTHQHLADMTGTARETVTKLLLELQNERLIRIDQRKIVVCNLDALQRILDSARA